jgi:hypothetical protein
MNSPFEQVQPGAGAAAGVTGAGAAVAVALGQPWPLVALAPLTHCHSHWTDGAPAAAGPFFAVLLCNLSRRSASQFRVDFARFWPSHFVVSPLVRPSCGRHREALQGLCTCRGTGVDEIEVREFW